MAQLKKEIGLYGLTMVAIGSCIGSGIFLTPGQIAANMPTPINAILIQSGWAIILLLFWGTFEDVITYVAFTDWIFFGLTAFAVFIFRRSRKDMARSYKTTGYPFTPAIFIGITIFFVVNTLIEKPLQAWVGLLLMLMGTALFFFFKDRQRSKP